MAQFAFFMNGVSVAGVAGRLGILLAWDPADRGPTAADDVDVSNIGLYSWVGTWWPSGAGVCKIKSKSPKQIPPNGCPTYLDGGTDHDYFVKFGVKSGGTSGTGLYDVWLDVFEDSTKIYGIAPETSPMKIELAVHSITSAAEMSFQDRLTLQAWEDPPEGDFFTTLMGGGIASKEIWRELMTANLPLRWL